jgi:hypothetical protein
MTTNQEMERIVRSWLEPGLTTLTDDVLDPVLDQLPATPQRRPWWPARRTPTMNKIVGFGLAAAAGVAVLVVGAQLFGPAGNSGVGAGPMTTPEPSVAAPTKTPEPSAAEPSPSLEADLDEGPFLYSDELIPITVTIPAPGWSMDRLLGLVKNKNNQPPDGAYVIGPWSGANARYIPGDPCRWLSTMPDTPATTVDEIVAALASQASRDASEPVDITLDGHAGKSITLHVPDDAVFANGKFTNCDKEKGGRHAFCTFGTATDCLMWNAQGPGAIDELWIVDVDGLILLIDGAYYAQTPAEHVDELQAILGSLTFVE